MCRVVTHSLGGGVGAASRARMLVRSRLLAWDMPELVLDASLLVSELVTNAVLHASGDVTLTLAVADGMFEAGVGDASPGPLTPPRPRQLVTDGGEPMAEGGRGLYLLESLSAAWGVAATAAGKQVWFRLVVPQRWPFRAGCPCASDEASVLLDSGTRALAVAGPWDRD